MTIRVSAGIALRKGTLGATALDADVGVVESGAGPGVGVAVGEGTVSAPKMSGVGVIVGVTVASDVGVPAGPADGAVFGVCVGDGATVAPVSSVCEVTQALDTPSKIRTSAFVSIRISLPIFNLQIPLLAFQSGDLNQSRLLWKKVCHRGTERAEKITSLQEHSLISSVSAVCL
jgi:hypothetical protein